MSFNFNSSIFNLRHVKAILLIECWKVETTSQVFNGPLVDSELRERCPNDYFPCFCNAAATGEHYSITCDDVPVEDVKHIFKRTNSSREAVYDIRMRLPQSPDVRILTDQFSGKKVIHFQLVCPTLSLPLAIDSAPFK